MDYKASMSHQCDIVVKGKYCSINIKVNAEDKGHLASEFLLLFFVKLFTPVFQ